MCFSPFCLSLNYIFGLYKQVSKMAPLRFSASLFTILSTYIALLTTAKISTNSASSSQPMLGGDTNRSLSCYNALSLNICGQGFVSLHKRLPPNSTATSTTTSMQNISKQTITSTTSFSSSPATSLSTFVPTTSQIPTTSRTLSTSSQIATNHKSRLGRTTLLY